MRKLLKRILFPDKAYSLKEIHKGHYRMKYRGVPCQKCPFDYVLYQMIIHEINPDLIIEIGTNEGGSTLYLADLLQLNGNGIIHSIDINDKCPTIVKNHPRISLFHNGWGQYDLELSKKFKTILVIEDSSHSYQNTLDVIQRFKNVVTVGSYLIVEDGIVNDLNWSKSFQGGPVKAINEFMELNSNFIFDKNLENFFGKSATFNTLGYLKRVK